MHKTNLLVKINRLYINITRMNNYNTKVYVSSTRFDWIQIDTCVFTTRLNRINYKSDKNTLQAHRDLCVFTIILEYSCVMDLFTMISVLKSVRIVLASIFTYSLNVFDLYTQVSNSREYKIEFVYVWIHVNSSWFSLF